MQSELEGSGPSGCSTSNTRPRLPARPGVTQCLSYFKYSHSSTLLIPVVGIVREPSMWSCITSPPSLKRAAGSGGGVKQADGAELIRFDEITLGEVRLDWQPATVLVR